jgi:acetyl-CoA carboxylase biotin carboxyl carrier protein
MHDDLLLSAQDVAEIIAILDGTQYQRLEVRTSRFTLRVARSAGGWTQEWDWAGQEEPLATPASADRGAAPHDIAADEDGSAAVRAPLPGTFYRAPQPGAPPFVQVGDPTEADTVIGIIETMKLMTSVQAGVRGIISAILVENAALIDAGALILRVRTAP